MAIFPRTVQQTDPSATWTVTHQMGINPTVSVKVYDSGALTEILPVNIAFPDTSTVVITFSSPRTGEVRLA